MNRRSITVGDLRESVEFLNHRNVTDLNPLLLGLESWLDHMEKFEDRIELSKPLKELRGDDPKLFELIVTGLFSKENIFKDLDVYLIKKINYYKLLNHSLPYSKFKEFVQQFAPAFLLEALDISGRNQALIELAAALDWNDQDAKGLNKLMQFRLAFIVIEEVASFKKQLKKTP